MSEFPYEDKIHSEKVTILQDCFFIRQDKNW